MSAGSEEDSLVYESREWKGHADLLLKKSRLIEILANHGHVVLSGSYRLNLMMTGDIDLKVINSRITKNSATSILDRLIRQNFFNGYIFYDWMSRSPPVGFPRGYFIGLKRNYTLFNNRRWTIDIWLVRKPYDREERLMRLVERRLNNSSRNTILKFKKLKSAKRIEIPSVDIYRAVLEKGISSSREFLRFAGKQE